MGDNTNAQQNGGRMRPCKPQVSIFSRICKTRFPRLQRRPRMQMLCAHAMQMAKRILEMMVTIHIGRQKQQHLSAEENPEPEGGADMGEGNLGFDDCMELLADEFGNGECFNQQNALTSRGFLCARNFPCTVVKF